jgi:hypothetical protein
VTHAVYVVLYIVVLVVLFNHLSEVNLNMRRLFGFLIMLFTLLVLNIGSVKYLCFREDGRYPPIGYPQTILLERFSFKTLSERNKLMNLLFLYKILHNLIDCCSLLSQINFCVGKHSITTRSKNLFYLSTPRTDFLKFSPLNNMLNISNSVGDLVDLFSCSIEVLKSLDLSDI